MSKHITARRPALVFLAIICFTRLPLIPRQLFSFDNVNFAYALDNFDISRSQPQPPGDPVFVVEMRILRWLQFKRPESILLMLKLLGSAASCVALFWAGRRIFDDRAAWIAALLLALYPSFWFASLTSGVRVQLALISALVAGACWKAWQGDARAATAAGILLGLGSGARPEIGLMLLPLWAVGVWRSENSWTARLRQAGILTVCVLAWLVPLVIDSGGPGKFWRLTWAYFKTQAAGMTSGLFGADDRVWATTLIWVAVWALCGALALPFSAVLAWDRGWSVGRERAWFLWIWFLPGFLFAAGVHAADAGHVLAVVPPVCLLSAHLMNGAAERLRKHPSPLLVPVMLVCPPILVWLRFMARPEMIPWTIAIGGFIAGTLLRVAATPRTEWMPRWQATAIAVLPAIALSAQMFLHRNWYYGADNRAPALERARRDFHSGIKLMSLAYVREVTDADDHRLRAIFELMQEAGDRTVAVWDRGPIEWRKVSYYAPRLPVLVVEPDMTKIARGADVQLRAKDLRIPGPPRLILLTKNFPKDLTSVAWRENQSYVDLIPAQHEYWIGEVRLHW